MAPLLALACLACHRPPGRRVLFVGNSYTSTNDLPGMLRQLAASLGDRVETESEAPGGWSLQQHAGSGSTQAHIRSKAWDYVVLQEQSQRPDFPAWQLERDVIPFAVRLDELVHAAHPASRTVFFETWGHKDGDKMNCASLPETCTYEGMQGRISETYALLARKTSGLLAPAGAAWRAVRSAHPEIELYAPDGVHPSRQGSYLAACVLYAAMLGKDPRGASALGLEGSEAKLLQEAAQEAVSRPKTEPAP